MPEQDISQSDWYSSVKTYTQRLVNIRSVSPGDGEIRVVQEVLQLLYAGGLVNVYTASGLDPVKGDPYSRQNAYAFLRGQSSRTLVLLGHIDTVDTKDYGPLEPYALDPEALNAQQDALMALTEGLKGDMEAHPGDWMFGRGVIDMKSGVAVNIAVMRRLAEIARISTLRLSVVMLATPDEENESAGVLQAVDFLLGLREQYGLEYVGAINTDYTTSLYPGDPHRYVYTGTVGKLLPSFLVVGRESHVGEPFDGVDANLLAAELIRHLSMNVDLCDTVRGQITPPPVTLRATDLKSHYDVQLPFAAHFYLNVLTFTSSPEQLMERLCSLTETVLASTLGRIDAAEQRWMQGPGDRTLAEPLQPRSGVVLTYAGFYSELVQRLGEARVSAELKDEWERWPAALDKRERCLKLVHRLWTLSSRQGPAVVIYYSPPYYPHVAATPCTLHRVVSAVIAAHPELKLVQQEYFPFICDMSYLRLDPGANLAVLKANMPVWQDMGTGTQTGGYYLPFEAIQQLNLPVVNLGPYGRGAHQRGERALMSYSFGVLPQLLYETIERLAQLVE